MSRNLQLFTFAVLALAGGLISAQDGPPPGTSQLTPTLDLHLEPVALEVPEPFKDQVPADQVLNLPSGFSATVFAATGLERPRLMAFSPDGVLHVADMRGARTKDSKLSRIVAFPDRDGDGVADEAIVAADQLSYANSLAFYKGDLYVAETHQVVRLRDLDGDYVYEERDVFIADLPDIPGNGFHGTRTIVFDEVDEKIYLSVGSPCDLCRQDEPVAGSSEESLYQSDEWGTVLQFDADGTGRRVFARGMRNVIGMDLHPVTRQLWGTHNHYDLGGAELPPEWIDIIRDDGFYGYPFVYGYQAWVDFSIPQYQKILPLTRRDSLLVQTQPRPAALVPAHLAPMAIHFYDGDLFSSMYRNAAFVALRGGEVAGNLAVVPGFKVIAIFSEADGSKARVADFLTGFKSGSSGSRVWGKPVGLTTDREGNLYVSSDHSTRAIFRIAPIIVMASWDHTLPDEVLSGTALDLAFTVRLERFDPEGKPPTVTADLRAVGGPADLPLQAVDDSTYRLEHSLPIELRNGQFEVAVWIRQENEAGLHQMKLAHSLTVVPTADEVIFADALDSNWTLIQNSRIKVDIAAREVVYRGQRASALQVEPGGFGGWKAEFQAVQPLDLAGYKALRFAFHPGNAELSGGEDFSVFLSSTTPLVGIWYDNDEARTRSIDLLRQGEEASGVDIDRKQWQVVEIPLEAFGFVGPFDVILFSGTLEGTFYLDDIRLVTSTLAPAPVTVVLEEERAGLPQRFALEQNYPNPFNSETVIRFALPEADLVELAVYNLTGQKVATLVRGQRPAGLFTVRWDGRNEDGSELASGIYIYRLRAGAQANAKKLLLLR